MKSKLIGLAAVFLVFCLVAGCSVQGSVDVISSTQIEFFSEITAESQTSESSSEAVTSADIQTSELPEAAATASAEAVSETIVAATTRRGAVITYTPTTAAKPVTTAAKTTAAVATATVAATSAKSTTAAATTSTTRKISHAVPSESTTKKTTVPATTAAPSTVTLYIDCKTAVKAGIRDNPGYASIIPENGVLLNTTVSLNDGDTVMSLAERALKANGIALNSQHGYIKGISGLNEKDCGGTSGWLYSVNGTFPKYSAATYTLCSGDSVRMLYSVTNGDVEYID